MSVLSADEYQRQKKNSMTVIVRGVERIWEIPMDYKTYIDGQEIYHTVPYCGARKDEGEKNDT